MSLPVGELAWPLTTLIRFYRIDVLIMPVKELMKKLPKDGSSLRPSRSENYMVGPTPQEARCELPRTPERAQRPPEKDHPTAVKELEECAEK